MSDIAIDSDLDVYIDQSGDLALATGRAELDQQIALVLNHHYANVIGENDPDTVVEQLKVGARRAVSYVGSLESVDTIDAAYKEDEPNTVELRILFDTGEALVFDGDDEGIMKVSSLGRAYDDGISEDEFSFDIYDDGTKK